MDDLEELDDPDWTVDWPVWGALGVRSGTSEASSVDSKSSSVYRHRPPVEMRVSRYPNPALGRWPNLVIR